MTEQDVPYEDYRSSHLDKGRGYHDKFEGANYRAVLWELERAILTKIVQDRDGDHRSLRHLDFACGTGRVLRHLSPLVGQSVGVDVSESMIEVAREELPEVQVHLADITRDPVLDDQQFDLVTAFRFFPNAEGQLRDDAMARLAQLLAPGGVIVFNNHIRKGSLRFAFRRFLSFIGIKRKKNRDLHTMSDGEAKALAKKHGLTITASHHMGVLPILRDKRSLLPIFIVRGLERIGAALPFLAPLASNKIYVLSPRNSHDGQSSRAD